MMLGHEEFPADQPQGKVLWIESFNIYGELVTTLIIPGQLGNFQVMMWPRPVDSGKVQIMDLEKRICLERVKFKRGQVDKITDALSVPQPGTVLQKV